MTNTVPVRTVIERGPKGKRSVAFGIDWPGWSRGGPMGEADLEDFAKQVGLRISEGAALSTDGLRQHREACVAAMRAYNAGGVTRRMRSWTLPFLIRHSAFHTLDHAWEMEDKDLSAEDGARPTTPPAAGGGPGRVGRANLFSEIAL